MHLHIDMLVHVGGTGGREYDADFPVRADVGPQSLAGGPYN